MTVAIVIGLILLTVFFEWLKDKMEEAVPREMRGKEQTQQPKKSRRA